MLGSRPHFYPCVYRLPGIRPFLRNMTGIDPDASPVDPDLAVALGAAIQAGMLEGSVERLMVFDVWQVRCMRAKPSTLHLPT